MVTQSMGSKPQVASWNLPASTRDAPAEEFFQLSDGGSEGEGIFEPDLRRKVNPVDFADGGKYRSIVKLMMQYQNQDVGSTAWGLGTGWLIAPDIVVTAGHCAYDWSNSLGPVRTVKAYIGYSGKDSINRNSSSVQLRMGKQIVTTVEWLQSEGSDRTSDVSFIRLDRPFNGVLNTFSYQNTSASRTAALGVVGYPADKSFNGEEAAQMWEQFNQATWDIEQSQTHMLEYKISTFAGQCGSPVLCMNGNNFSSIGVHVYRGGNISSGSTIAGKFGNNFEAMRTFFAQPSDKISDLHGVDIFQTQASGEPTLSFLTTFKDISTAVLPMPSNELSVVSPILGPIGGPIAALGGAVLGALGQVYDSSFTSTGVVTSPTSVSSMSFDGCAERAVLCEAALQTVEKLDLNSEEASKILHQMETTYRTLKPSLKLAPVLNDALESLSLQPKIYDLAIPKSPESDIETCKQLTVDNSESFTGCDPKAIAFVQALVDSPTTIEHSGKKGRFWSLGSQMAKVILDDSKSGVQFGLSQHSDALAELSESAFGNTNPTTEIISKRAIMGEAALQAILQVPPTELESLRLYDQNNKLSTANFFGSFRDVIQDIGRKVVAAAPVVIKAAVPIASDILKSHGEKEST